MDSTTAVPLVVYVARTLIGLAILALLGAWLTQLTGTTLLGMDQHHLFSDAIVLSILGSAFFLEALWRSRRT